jgi:hypothetical protein
VIIKTINNMKISVITISLFLFSLGTAGFSQWQGDTRLTNDPYGSFTSFNNEFCVVSSGNYVHIAWYDLRHEGGIGNSEIFYKRSTDGGTSWGNDTRLTNALSNSDTPTLMVVGSVVHLVWRENRDSNYEIYYKRSTDNGTTWTADTRLTYTAQHSISPASFISGQVIHLVWEEEPVLFNTEIYYKRSTNGGISWDSLVRLTNWTGDSFSPSVAVSGLNVHVTWTDMRDGQTEIYYMRSTDGGTTWGNDSRMSVNDFLNSEFAMVAASGSDVNLIWSDTRATGGYSQVFFKHSSNSGENWGPDSNITTNASNKYYPSFVLSGSNIHTIWEDRRDGNPEIYYKNSTNSGISWGADVRLTNNTAVSEFVSMAVSGTALHVVWRDTRDGNHEIYYKRNPTGNPIGISIVNFEIPEKFSLSQNYPNPFNPETNIEFTVPKSSMVKIIIYNLLGKEIEILVNESLNAGIYKVIWNASDCPSGIYFYKFESAGIVESKKMILIK